VAIESDSISASFSKTFAVTRHCLLVASLRASETTVRIGEAARGNDLVRTVPVLPVVLWAMGVIHGTTNHQ